MDSTLCSKSAPMRSILLMKQTRNVVSISLSPDRLRLRLDALAGVKHRNHAVQNAQRSLDLGREVDVTGRVDQVDRVAPARERDRGGVDGDPRVCSCSSKSVVVVPSSTSPMRCPPGVEQDAAPWSWSCRRRCARQRRCCG